MDAIAVLLAHEVPVSVALVQKLELQQDCPVLLYSSHGVLVGEPAKPLAVLRVNRRLEIQHAAPLVSVAEERKTVDGGGIA